VSDEPPFSLQGGPLQRCGARLGLVRGSNVLGIGLALGIATWAVLAGLAWYDGVTRDFYSLRVVGAHVRLLVMVPLLFACESMVAPRMASFIDSTLRERCVATGSRADLESLIGRVRRTADSWWLEALCLAAALAIAPLAVTPLVAQTGALGLSTAADPVRAIAPDSHAALWWWQVCLPLTRFLLLRWLARLALWAWFLRRVAGLELNLLPHHPDEAGGLGGLETVHRYFAPAVVAFGALVAASFAEDIASGAIPFSSIYIVLLTLLAVVAALLIGPMLVFSPKLRAARIEGSRAYRNFAARYVREFDSKWLGTTVPTESLLGSPDIQSLADLANGAQTVRDMRTVPAGRGLLTMYAVALAAPFLPLLLIKYPLVELAAVLVKRLFGA
jgi:hypothetical protein